MFARFRRPPPPAPEVQEAIDERDALFADARRATRKVDRVTARIIEEYELAEHQRRGEPT